MLLRNVAARHTFQIVYHADLVLHQQIVERLHRSNLRPVGGRADVDRDGEQNVAQLFEVELLREFILRHINPERALFCSGQALHFHTPRSVERRHLVKVYAAKLLERVVKVLLCQLERRVRCAL